MLLHPQRSVRFAAGFLLLLGLLAPITPIRAAPATASTPFTVVQRPNGWWLISPAGEPIFSVGVCVLTQGATRESYDPENPSYAAWRYYADSGVWADAMLRRLKSWNFTTLGGWADFDTLRASREQTLWLTPVLHIGSTAGAPWWDLWDAQNIRRMEEVARRQILPLRNDPRVIGYFSDNELGWWNATLWKMTLEQTPASGQRQRLLQLLRDTYANDYAKLRADFEPVHADDWAELERGGMLWARSGGQGIRVMRQFLRLIADRYYQLMRQIIRDLDPRALFLGDRYQSFYYPEVAHAAGRHVDVVSSNLNAAWSDGTLLRCYLDTLHGLTGKPILVSEFYAAARDNRSGNKNTHGVYPVVDTQARRAETARNTMHALVRLPYVVGLEWFQCFDEPRHGREDGENFNFGLLDIHDRPYAEVTTEFATLDALRRKSQPFAPRPDASAGVPPAPTEPFAQLEPTRALQHWDRERGFVKSASEFPVGDLYLCWSPRAVYVGLYAFDYVEAAFYQSGFIPKADRAQWTVQINGGETIRARIGAGREPLINNPTVRIENLSGVGQTVRNIAILELPAKLFGQETLAAGATFEFQSMLLTHGQAYRVEWRGRLTLAGPAGAPAEPRR